MLRKINFQKILVGLLIAFCIYALLVAIFPSLGFGDISFSPGHTVTFYADGVAVGSDSSSPYSLQWIPLSAGNKVITAVVSDGANSKTSSPVNIAVSPAPTAPNAPSNLQASISSSQVSLSWTDNSNNENGFIVQRSGTGDNICTGDLNCYSLGIDECENLGCYLESDDDDGNQYCIGDPTDTGCNKNFGNDAESCGNHAYAGCVWNTGAPYGPYVTIANLSTGSTNYVDTSVVSGGSYYYVIRAFNGVGLSSSSPYAGANIPTNAPPKVGVGSPLDGAKVYLNQPVSIVVNATDSDGSVSRVDFIVNDGVIGSDSIFPYTISWTPTFLGSHILGARATDNTGAIAYSAKVGVVAEIPVGGTSASGFIGRYYNNANLRSFFTARNDSYVSFNWGLGAPVSGMNVDTFSIRWSASFIAPETGSYTFYVATNDGTRLTVGGVRLIDQWQKSSSTRNFVGSRTLVAGQRYSVQLDYFDSSGAAEVNFEWKTPSGTRELFGGAKVSQA